MDFCNRRTVYRGLGVVLLLGAFLPTWTQNTSTPGGDNSKVNQQDRQPTEPTADQQKNNQSDVELTRQIRRSLTKDKSLSTYAHNLKVIAQDGKVTLKGPVRSDQERDTVLSKAAEVAGQKNINDEITVVPKH
jgi:hyperosmotically inducible protein